MNRSILVAALTLLAALTTLSGCSQESADSSSLQPLMNTPMTRGNTAMKPVPPVSMAMKPMPRSR